MFERGHYYGKCLWRNATIRRHMSQRHTPELQGVSGSRDESLLRSGSGLSKVTPRSSCCPQRPCVPLQWCSHQHPPTPQRTSVSMRKSLLTQDCSLLIIPQVRSGEAVLTASFIPLWWLINYTNTLQSVRVKWNLNVNENYQFDYSFSRSCYNWSCFIEEYTFYLTEGFQNLASS